MQKQSQIWVRPLSGGRTFLYPYINTESNYDESFRTIAFDEAIDLYLKQSCDKFIFVIENGKVLIGLIDAEC